MNRHHFQLASSRFYKYRNYTLLFKDIDVLQRVPTYHNLLCNFMGLLLNVYYYIIYQRIPKYSVYYMRTHISFHQRQLSNSKVSNVLSPQLNVSFLFIFVNRIVLRIFLSLYSQNKGVRRRSFEIIHEIHRYMYLMYYLKNHRMRIWS